MNPDASFLNTDIRQDPARTELTGLEPLAKSHPSPWHGTIPSANRFLSGKPMQDELKVDAAHFWERSLVLMDRFESQTDLGYVLFHAIAPYCELAITHDLGLWGFREIPEPGNALKNGFYRQHVWRALRAADYSEDDFNRIEALLKEHLDATLEHIANDRSFQDRRARRPIFEFVFEKIVALQQVVHPQHCLISTQLSKALLSAFELADEYFPYTGDFQIAALHARGYTSGKLSTFHTAPHHGLLRLRLLAYKINLETASTFPSEHFGIAKRFLLVDQGGRTAQQLKKQNIAPLPEIIEHILVPPAWFYPLSMVVLHNPLPITVSRRLIASQQIRAVIDFETLSPTGRTKTATAVILGRSPLLADEKVLFIDVTKLTRWNNAAVLTTAAELAGNILALGLNRGKPNPLSGEHRYATLLNNFFLSNFSEGYQDVSGICERLSPDKLSYKANVIRAANYLTQVNESQIPVGLDATPLLAGLPPDTGDRACLYVIGNNGVGKSFLLRNLVVSLSERCVSTFGIAFGLTDRFGYAATHKPAAFQYLGTGCPRSTNALKHHCTSLAGMMCLLYRSASRTAAFQSASSALGLSGRYYVMPWRMTSADIENDRGLSDINRIDNLMSDFDLHPDYKLGVVGDSGGGAITPFDELSSGEQQLLSLIIKITANATPGSVVLIDEPEISLHVTWQQALPALLDSLSRSLECSFVVATHSPVITANAFHPYDHCYAAKHGKLHPITTTQRRSVESALFDGFDTYTPNNRQIHERCAAIVSSVIRSMNQSGIIDASSIKAFDEELQQMRATVEGKGNNSASPHYEDDLALILKARMAIEELRTGLQGQST
ncbi:MULTISPECIES: AAA family ATPase [unclassified Pseudomonas]|nr:MULTISPECIES: AAA family ATPase [unclassified Pseudomonas]